MSAKQIAFDQEAREAMKRGITKLARAVKVTAKTECGLKAPTRSP